MPTYTQADLNQESIDAINEPIDELETITLEELKKLLVEENEPEKEPNG